MRSFFFLICTFILIVTFQISFLWYISFLDVVPDILLILVVWFSLWKGPLKGEIMGFSVGIVKDAFSIGIFGANALFLTCAGLFVGLLKKKIDENNKFVQGLLGILVSFFYCFGFWILTKILGEGKGKILGKSLLFLPLYNGLLTPFCFVVLDWWARLWREKIYVAD